VSFFKEKKKGYRSGVGCNHGDKWKKGDPKNLLRQEKTRGSNPTKEESTFLWLGELEKRGVGLQGSGKDKKKKKGEWAGGHESCT